MYATYDALGRMVEQSSGSTYQQILWSPMGKTALMNGQTLVKAFIPLPGGGTAIYNSSGLAYYRHADWLGSSRLTSTQPQSSGQSSAMYSSAAYAPFGEQYATAGTPDPSFTGQDSDTDPSMYDFTFRQYNPRQGRWISPDPLGTGAVDMTDPRSWNRYVYVRDNPLSYTDPLGLQLGYCTVNGTQWDDADSDDEDDGEASCEGPGGAGGIWVNYVLVTSVTVNGDDPNGVDPDDGSLSYTIGLPTANTSNCVTPTTIQTAAISIAQTVASNRGKTVLFGLGTSGGIGLGKGMGMYGSASVQIAVSPSGSAAYVMTYAAPAVFTGASGTYAWLTPSTKGAGFLAGAQFGFSNVTDPSQLSGPGVDASFSMADGIGIGVDVLVWKWGLSSQCHPWIRRRGQGISRGGH